ncbi:PmoA family protein [Microbacterium sp. M28]|uniref:DUF6807 domain-containing protein n=1 Tax=Microbacterium sp. M28 TaxID=2962064 RepID=UPI0021F46E37|nr:PmoA family protein [Microbacterium sp. M28]UYO97551.1 PmoA family protein [Microbacterium sp. M28]
MTIELMRLGSAVVEYHDGIGVDHDLSPRPFLTATTPLGVAVTQVEPGDHRHHLGVSAAMPDVNGTSFWGGRTYVRERGSLMLDNHGMQQVTSRDVRDGTIVEQVVWRDALGATLLDEERTITVRPGDGVWEVVWASRLTAPEQDVSFGSPQTNGRPGAFYGGLFWRAPFPEARVRTADGSGVDAAHGSLSPWICLDAEDASLVGASTNGLPWFVRAEGYVGFGPAVAVEGRRELPRGETLHLDLAVAILERSPVDPAGVAEQLLAGVGDAV